MNFFVVGNSIKLQKWFWQEKIVGSQFTLGPMAYATLVLIISHFIFIKGYVNFAKRYITIGIYNIDIATLVFSKLM